ncbi:MAG: hypothetical protein M1829_004367 [Trizodia sp. TS-e1964]|nr:MAG: hypothetical protein M1829_004367 [Trizodia sp. TS-e1964]
MAPPHIQYPPTIVPRSDPITPSFLLGWTGKSKLLVDSVTEPGSSSVAALAKGWDVLQSNVHWAVLHSPLSIPPITLDNQEALDKEAPAINEILKSVLNGFESFATSNHADGGNPARFSAKTFLENMPSLNLRPDVLEVWSSELDKRLPPRFELPQKGNFFGWIKANPKVVLPVVAMVLIVSPVAIKGALGLIGFGTLGPIPASLATAWQSSIGLVPAGSLFAWCQSAAVGGTFLESALIPGGLAAAGIAAIVVEIAQSRILEKYWKDFLFAAEEEVLGI